MPNQTWQRRTSDAQKKRGRQWRNFSPYPGARDIRDHADRSQSSTVPPWHSDRASFRTPSSELEAQPPEGNSSRIKGSKTPKRKSGVAYPAQENERNSTTYTSQAAAKFTKLHRIHVFVDKPPTQRYFLFSCRVSRTLTSRAVFKRAFRPDETAKKRYYVAKERKHI